MADKDFVVKNGLVVNTSVLVANGTKVGVNTASPDAALTVAGTANLQGNVSFTGNEIITTANSTFFGNVHTKNSVFIDKKLYVGNTETMVQDLPTIIQAVDNFNGFVMVSSQNLSKEDDACADLLIYADDTNGLSNFNDLGINNSRFDGRIQRIIVNSVANSWSLGQTVYQRNSSGANIAVGELRDIASINSTAVSLKIRISEDDGLATYVGMSDFSNTTGSNLSLYAVTSAANSSIIAAVPFFSPEANTLTRRNYAFTIAKRGDGYLYNANSALTIGTTAGGIRSTTETISTGFSSGVNTIVLSSGNTKNIKADMNLSGTGIDTGTYITSVVNSTAFKISKPTTTTSAGSITARDEFYDIDDINNPIIFHTGGMMAKNEISRFTGNGNFVIGPFTTSRAAKLNVNGTANIAGQTNVGANVNVVGNINASANVMAPVGMFATSVNVGAASTNSTTFVIGNATVNATAINMAGNTTVSSATLRSSNLTMGNTSVTDAGAFVRIQNSTVSSNLTAVGLAVGISTVNSTLMSVGANVVANASTVSVGNTTVKAVLSQNATAAMQVTGNATVSANLTTANLIITNSVLGQANFAGNVAISGNTNVTGNVYAPSGVFSTSANIGIVSVSTTDINVGANVRVDSAGLAITGNSSVASVNVAAALVALGNSTVTGSPTVQVSNASFTANVIPGSFVAGISTVNTSAMSVGANVVANASTVSVGNTTVKAVLSQNAAAALQVTGNATISANLTTGNLIVTSAVRGDTTFANSLNVTGNTNVTGNVYAPSGVFSTSANIGSVSISTADVNVGSNVKVDVSGLKVTGNSTLASINVSSGDVILGNNSVVDTPYMQVQNSTASANLTSIGLAAGISTVNTTAMSVGANVLANASTVSVGNATIGVVASQNTTLALQVSGNASVSGNLTTGNLTVTSAVRGNLSLANNLAVTGNTNVTGNVYAPSGVFSTSANVGLVSVSTSDVNVGSNVKVDTSGLKVTGNSTLASINVSSGDIILGNSSVVDAPYVQVINASASANLTSIGLAAGISTVNTTAVSVGANVLVNASAVSVGNATIGVVASQNETLALQVSGNASVSGNLTTGNLTVTSAVRGNLSLANNLTVTGNTNVTGNVYAPSGVFSTSANIGAVAISTSAVTVGSNVTVDAAGFKVVGNSTVASMNIVSGNVIVGNSFIAAAPTVQVINSTSSANVSPGLFSAGISGVNTTAVYVGANVVSNASAVSVGNSTINVVLTQNATAALQVSGNANVSADLTTANLIVTSAIRNQTTVANNLIVSGNISITGNSSVTGNVYAPSGVFTTSANIGAVAISTSAVTVGSNVTVDAAGLRVAGNSSVASMNVMSGNIVIGNNSITSAPTVQISNTTASANLSPSGVNAGILGVFGNTTTAVINVGSNVTINTSVIAVGNSSVNVVIKPSDPSYQLNLQGNAYVNGDVIITKNLTVSGTTTYSGTTVAAGNFIPSINATFDIGNSSVYWKTTYARDIVVPNNGIVSIGNTTVNAVINSSSAVIGNSTVNAVINSTSLLVGNIVSTSVNASANVRVGANVLMNATSLAAANATAITVHSAGGIIAGNDSIVSAPQIVVQNTAGITTINSNFISTTSISGNLTGNVVATTISGNVTATTISGNLTGNVVSTVLSTTNATVSGTIVASNTAANSTTAAAMWLSGTAGSLSIDNNMAKRLSWNDSAGSSLSLRSGHFSNGTTNLFRSDGVGSGGAAAITFTTDGATTNGIITQSVAVANGDGNSVVWVTNTTLNTTSFGVGANLAVTGNTSISGFAAISGNATIGGNVTITGNLIVLGSTTTQDTASLTVTDLVITVAKNAASPAAADGAGLKVDTANATLLYKNASNTWLSNVNFTVGNSTSNVFANSTAFVGNTVGAHTGNVVGNVVAATISSSANITVGSNVLITTANLAIGNSTANVYVNSTSFVGNVAATTITGNLTGNVVATNISGNLTGNVVATNISGNLTGNVVSTTMSATSNIAVGANVLITTANLAIGNSTANVYANSTAFIGNVVATRVTGNLVGNVTATTITGNLAGNVVATTITGNLAGNVAATTITGNLTGNVSSTTIAASANVAVGANVLITTANLAIGNSTANVYVNSTAFVGNVVASSLSGNLVGNVAATTITGNLTGNVVATNISGNLTGNVAAITITGNLTGNVAATTISGNLTGNVVATTLSGNLTGNVAAITITGNLTGNVIATTITGNLTGNVAATTLSASANIAVGANVLITTANLAIGNSTANVYVNSTSFVGNVTATSINSTANIVVGANVLVNTSTLAIGNSTANVFVNSTAFVGNVVATRVAGNLVGNVAATSITGNLVGNVAATTITGNLTGNVAATTLSASANVAVGANVLITTANLAIGNSTANVYVNSTAFIGNTVGVHTGNVVAATLSGNLTGNVAATTITGNLTGNVVAITISGNLAGNVAATTITGNLTGNVAATTITGNLTGNVAATTITGNLVGNVAATTITGNLTGNVVGNVSSTTTAASANVTIGANVFINTSTLSISNTTATSIHSASLVTLGNSSIVSAPQIVVQNTAGTTTVNSTAISTSNLFLSATLLGVTINATTVNATTMQSTSMNVSTANALSYSLSGTQIANSTGVYATYFNGQQAAFYLNAGNLSGTLPYAQIPANVINTTADFTRTGVTTLNANLILGSSATAVGLQANGSYGTAGQVLVSNGTATYWSNVNAAAGIISSIVAGSGLTGGGTSGEVTLAIGGANGILVEADAISVVAGTGTVVNTSGIHVNPTYIATLDANNATYAYGKTEGNLNVNNATTVTNITRSYAVTADLNTLTTSGFYRSDVAENSPSSYGNMFVAQGGADTIGQIYVNYIDGTLYSRSAYGLPDTPTWSTWKTNLNSGNFNTYSPTLTGGGASGNWGINISGTASYANNLTSNRNNWGSAGVISAVVGQLGWKHYGSGHTIFDASNATSPDGGAIDRSNPDVTWTSTYPTLMGWNGANTYGVRVDSARFADYAYSASAMNYLGALVTNNGATTQTFYFPGGSLAPYQKVYMRISGVSHNGGSATYRSFLLNGQVCSDTYIGSGSWSGTIECDLGVGVGIFADAGAAASQLVSKTYGIYSGSASVSFTTSGSNGFDGGAIYFYGVR